MMNKVFILNLENNDLTAGHALTYLQEEILRAKKNKFKGIYIIHGYGSHGVGGVIGKKVRTYINKIYQEGQIKTFIWGENFNMWNENARKIVIDFPELKNEYKKGHNPGITIVIF